MSEALAFREKAEIEAKIEKIDAICGPEQNKLESSRRTYCSCSSIFVLVGLVGAVLGLCTSSALFFVFGLFLFLLSLFPLIILSVAISRFRARMAPLEGEKAVLLQSLEELRTPEVLQQRLLEIASAKETLAQERAKILKELEERRGTPYGREP